MIIGRHLLYSDPVETNGILIVGDPHVSSRKPGRRKDADWPAAILAKLEACIAIANERGLMPIFLGDLFDTPVEEDESLKTRLARILKSSWIPVLSNTGNHDQRNTTLSDGDSLAMFATADVLDVATASGPICTLSINGSKVGIGMTPYGQEIPRDVRGAVPGAERTIWFTHHDIAFEGTYPGGVAPFPIEGCRLAVNGHIHLTKKPMRAGETMWLNPGNINRQTVDLIDHVPCAWALGHDGKIVPIKLPHVKEVFDLTGRLVDASSTKDAVKDVESAFVSLLKAESSVEMEMSQDGSLIREEIEEKFRRDKTKGDIQAVVISLLGEAVARLGSGA